MLECVMTSTHLRVRSLSCSCVCVYSFLFRAMFILESCFPLAPTLHRAHPLLVYFAHMSDVEQLKALISSELARGAEIISANDKSKAVLIERLPGLSQYAAWFWGET